MINFIIISLRVTIFFLILINFTVIGFAQEGDAWFYLRARDTLFNPEFKSENNQLTYIGKDQKLKQLLKGHKISIFKKTFRNAKKENLKKTFFVVSENESLMYTLLEKAAYLFEFGELIKEEDKKIFEPNDYGLTSTIGSNIGAQVNLDYLDYIGLPQAWYYTTGSRDVIIGISDGGLDSTNVELKGKLKIFRKSPLNNGHGLSIAETAAGQGDNGIGIAGVCYDCGIFSTSYNNPSKLDQLLEISAAGAKVINCSWGSTTYYQTAQDAINEMFSNGTIIVAAGHNRSFSDTKGVVHFYPASYDKVISVSSAMHRYEKHSEHILKLDDTYYAENIRGYVGRTAGFPNNDTTQNPYIYSQSVRNLNSQIDILGPSVGIFRFSELLYNNVVATTEDSATSAVVPLITGTIGLMFSLAPCLPTDEVESILKITSTNIDDIEVNKPYAGLYGSGIIHAGRAVKMVYQLYAENEIATIENHDFTRWDFKLSSFSKGVVIQNQSFKDDSSLDLTAKRSIVIGENTHLKPGASSEIYLKIDPTLQKKCDLQLRDPNIEN